MELKKILNIMPDDKFLDYYITMSEKFIPNSSLYVIISNDSSLKYVKTISENVIKISIDDLCGEEFFQNLTSINKIVFHGLRPEYKSFVKKLPTNILLLWIFWGFEGYITQRKNNYVSSQTTKLRFQKSIKGFAKFLRASYFNNRINSAGKKYIDLINRMDYCVTWVEGDYDLAKTVNPNLKHLYFNYFDVNLMDFPVPKSINDKLETIMIGNSASEYNNHLEALKYLEKHNFRGKIYMPLSYGGNEFYVKNLITVGKKMFRDNFVPLTEFLDLPNYQKIINECDVVWMNHRRQQAAGNILVSLYTGKVVVLNEKNSLFNTFKSWDIRIFNKDVIINKDFSAIDLDNQKKITDNIDLNRNIPFFNFLK